MANLKSLTKDTAIYGLSSIIGRFLNYLLVPLYTDAITKASGGYGVITNIYAYTALLLVILTYGMETTFFRFANKSEEDPKKVYATILLSVGTTSLLFVIFVFIFLSPISSAMGYADHPSYIWVMAMVVAIDAFQCIPFAYLRYQKRPIKFAALKLLFVVLNITLNLIFFLLLPALYKTHPDVIGHIYDPSVGAGYAFYINLACTAPITFFFYKELTGFKYTFDKQLMRRMMKYSWPILVLGIAGILNQTADKIMFPYIYKGNDAHAQLGIYGAASKIAMIMAMITQAFRYAYEPFVFGKAEDKNNRETYAKAMKYFLIFTLLAFLVVVGYMDILRYIIHRDYWEGLQVVPIVMAAEIMMGVYFNLSFWYKLIDKTIWGAYFSGIGCIVLVAINIIFVPRYGYMACAWAGFAGYATAMTLSYIIGQKKYPIAYPLGSMAIYVAITVLFYAVMTYANNHFSTGWALLCNTIVLILFVAHIIRWDFPLHSLPLIGKYFKK
ncbi:polysaccharide biosynthesis protein [Hoylesella saccharolytica F0055]|uniref:Polysaccharide biosynthesis protein n=1 Tax=Hoylesella saccharolytica F0055 TaxID=1127699 RepID=L1NFE3_9BACT|nr:oligosaccharide flippase family protein [Hoylesella saccharolytica]EKY02000.1 polysaccharide biosynthesis protein [Hoylesella saccharolytica F0055]